VQQEPQLVEPPVQAPEPQELQELQELELVEPPVQLVQLVPER
jgi:hypothetical protein